jgi:4-hydroxythreonine-4-phosphate dehydrogenase
LYACYFCQCENNVIHKKEFRVSCPLHGIDKLENCSRKINVLNLWKEGVDLNLGVNDDKVGQYAVKSFTATDALQEKLVDV